MFVTQPIAHIGSVTISRRVEISDEEIRAAEERRKAEHEAWRRAHYADMRARAHDGIFEDVTAASIVSMPLYAFGDTVAECEAAMERCGASWARQDRKVQFQKPAATDGYFMAYGSRERFGGY